jgi:integrase
MLFKRKGSPHWYYKFTVDGKTVYKSTGTENKAKAEEIAAKNFSSVFDQVKLGKKPRYLWQEAVNRWLSETENKSIEEAKDHFRWLRKHLDNKYLDEITQDVIEELIKAKLKEAGKARVNRMTSQVSAVLTKACKIWKWTDSTPYIRKFKENNKRIRWLTPDEAARLLGELPPHLWAMAVFSLATGLRESNVTGLEWNQIDMRNRIAWIHADQAKGDKDIRVPLNDDAIAVLRQQLGKHNVRVFAYLGKPVIKAGVTAFKNALKRAEIANFRWHDLRHTWASWHVQGGTPLNVLQELGGWSDYRMVQRYAHLAPEHLAEHANRVSGLTKRAETVLRKVK